MCSLWRIFLGCYVCAFARDSVLSPFLFHARQQFVVDRLHVRQAEQATQFLGCQVHVDVDFQSRCPTVWWLIEVMVAERMLPLVQSDRLAGDALLPDGLFQFADALAAVDLP